MDAHNRVLLDANIWYSRTLTDWFFLIYLSSERPPFLILWSEDILAEAHYHLRKTIPAFRAGPSTGVLRGSGESSKTAGSKTTKLAIGPTRT